MNRLDAQRLAKKAYCPEPQCEGKSVVIDFAPPPERGYIVRCSTNGSHNLSIAMSMFAELLDRWRQGDTLFGLKNEIFQKTMTKLGWNYETVDGIIIRIGKDYASWYEGEKDMSQALQLRDYTPAQIDLIKTQIIKGARPATDDELLYFFEVCRRTGLDPFRKQIYGIMRKDDGVLTLTIQTGIEGYRSLAARSKDYAGRDDAQYGPVDKDGFPEWASVTA